MLKKFTAADRFESGIDSIIRGKAYAFVPVAGDNRFVALGVAIAGESGTYPIAIGWCYATSYQEMAAHAVDLNRRDGIADEIAAQTIRSTRLARAGEPSAAVPTDGADCGGIAQERPNPALAAEMKGAARQRELLRSLFRKMWFRSHRVRRER
jgi:hypothetical protein